MLAGFRRHLKYLAHKLHILCHVIPTKWRSCRDHRLCDVTSPCVYKRPPSSNEVDDSLRRSPGRGEIFEARAEFGTKFQREVTLFWRCKNFLVTQCRISRSRKANATACNFWNVRKAGSIFRSSVAFSKQALQLWYLFLSSSSIIVGNNQSVDQEQWLETAYSRAKLSTSAYLM